MKTVLIVLLGVAQILASSQIDEFTSITQQSSADLHNQLLQNNDNFVASAFSLETLFAVLQSGAVAETGDEIRQSFHFPSTKEETDDLLKASLAVVESDFHTLAAVTKMFVQGGTLNEDFENVAGDAYQVVFQKVLDSSTSKVELDGAFSVILSNDLSFKADWEVPFEIGGGGVFHVADDVRVSLVTMVQEAELNYYESEELDAQILELPLTGEEASLTIVLPNQVDGITLLDEKIEQVLATPEFAKETVQVEIPRFQLATALDLTEVIKNMGIAKIFDSEQADFSGIGGAKGDIFIKKLEQDVVIDINENGVGAAVDTQIDGYKLPVASANKVFKADHPFIFYIKVHDVVVFEGRVVNPAR